MKRGSLGFEVTAAGDLIDCTDNVERLRELWLDRSMIHGDDLGPGDAGDFDNGAWHVACHLVAAGGIRRAADGRLLWLEISHDTAADTYFASVTQAAGTLFTTRRLDSAEGRRLLDGSELLGFVEGNSLGQISARSADDPGDRFNGWTRQQFAQPVGSTSDGGKVWEHWCTTRDIRPSHAIGSSVLRAYVALLAALGDHFLPAVARGRRDYGHPKQLCALVRAGLTAEASAWWDISPDAIDDAPARTLLEATPVDALSAAGMLRWENPQRYYMFKRRIGSWSPASLVRRDLEAFRAALG